MATTTLNFKHRYCLVSIGGSAGLFVGASMLSFVEIVYYFTIRALWNKVIKKRELEKNEKVKEREMEGSHSSVTTLPHAYHQHQQDLGRMPKYSYLP